MSFIFSNSRFGRHTGFTLIELLAVIAIVSVLALLIAPAIRTVRTSSQFAQNTSNLRALAMASHLYAADNDGIMPTIVFNNNGIQRTQGKNIFPNRKDVLRILSNQYYQDNVNPDEVTEGYIDTPEVFYSPFTPVATTQERAHGRLKPYGVGFTVSYTFYSLPTGVNPIVSGLANENIYDTQTLATTVLFADPTIPGEVDGEFTGPKISAVRMDGSIATFELSRFEGLSANNRIRVLSSVD